MPGFERREVEPRVAPVRPAEMRLGDQPAQVRVSLRRLREQRHVRPVEQRQLRAGDRLQTERLRLLRERHRAVQAIVIGEGERRKPKLEAVSASCSGSEAPSRNEKAEWQWSSMYM